MFYTVIIQMKKRAVKGVINVTMSGSGYVSSEELEKDVRIDPLLLNTALDGDEVEALIHPEKKGENLQGEVIKVLKRKRTRFVGTLESKKGQKFSFLIPDDKRVYADIFIPDSRAKSGNKALVEIIKWDDQKKNPEGKIIKVIGKKGDNDAELHSIVLEKGLPIEFSKEVEEEAKKIAKNSDSSEKRKDFRHVCTFTIDPEDAKDFDDAFSVKDIGNGDFEVGVHIADVSHYVKKGTLLDEEARKRAFSIYLVDRTIPMLPEVLSNDACSLMPDKDRNAFSAVFVMNKEGKVKERWFGEALIRSNRRFTYKEAQDILDRKKGEFFKELHFLSLVSERFRKQRTERGALDFDDDELQFSLDHDGRPLFVYKKEKLFTHKLVEEFMILANREVASTFGVLYRVHESPKENAMKSLVSFLSKIGHMASMDVSEVTSRELNEMLTMVEGKKEEFLVKSVVLQSMSKAAYSVKNKKHFGLALKEYTHFTSPIRRYADLLVHRIVKEKIKGRNVNAGDYAKVAEEISLRELDVLSAERDSISYKKVQYMMEKIGEVFEGVISGVTRFGIFVRLSETHAEGLVSIKDMEDDYYILDEETYSLIGTKKNKRYSLGDTVKVKLVGGSIETRRLEFVFNR